MCWLLLWYPVAFTSPIALAAIGCELHHCRVVPSFTPSIIHLTRIVQMKSYDSAAIGLVIRSLIFYVKLEFIVKY